MTDRDRLFVPLKREHWLNFYHLDKTWELRGVNANFNRNTVWNGREVELRLGYTIGRSLWGEIVDLVVRTSIAEIAVVTGHEAILPGSTMDEFVASATDMLAGYSEYVAFKPDGLQYNLRAGPAPGPPPVHIDPDEPGVVV